MRTGGAVKTDSALSPGTPDIGRLIRLPSRTAGWLDSPGADPDLPSVPPPLRPNRDSLSVLLVEDEPGDARLVQLALMGCRKPAFAVTHVSSLTEAIAILAGGAALDVVLLDLSLPDSTGLDTVARMKDAAPRIPIVIMTGMDDQRLAAAALEAGAQDYLVKSDDPERTVGRAIRYAITRMASQIERETLLRRIAQQQRTLMTEIDAARAMQFDLLPRPERIDPRLAELGLEVESFFEPSLGIGGDLWGCLDCGGQRMSFYSFDFTGHGIGAALNVFRLHALISDRWTPDQTPAETLRLLGIALRGLLARGHFATMFLCTIDCGRGEIEWASAGAPAPLMIADGGVRFLDAQGVPLGLSADPHYRNRCEPFPPGAALMIYSDAITDAPKEEGDLFGEAGLIALAQEMIDRTGRSAIADLIDAFQARVRMPLEDDMTALGIRRLAETP
ncbi:PP2C family protein-serine/threonine phosphatase [Magnetospirillum molischianum]|uniref:Two-component response serine phosphatase Rsb transcriptional regulator of sigma subunit n=1 Tax=Magnetospirillum molischianum DSM 120 TaxID=1150626 RepID=H8FNG8_MAGML|nr:SpoIIE family protein phosphatase [Magnetospirillum molischianum]CCG39906.1 Two-component response serine phosphatase Rsb transcriptional regulator of sigma subunit [Magnetospirillum molischianum DSM 120]